MMLGCGVGILGCPNGVMVGCGVGILGCDDVMMLGWWNND